MSFSYSRIIFLYLLLIRCKGMNNLPILGVLCMYFCMRNKIFFKKWAECLQIQKKVVPLHRFWKGALLKGSLGEMAEWSIAAVLKTVVLRGTGGSNPSLSAKKRLWIIRFATSFFYELFFHSFVSFIKQEQMNDYERIVKWKWISIILVIILVMALCMHAWKKSRKFSDFSELCFFFVGRKGIFLWRYW